MSISLNPRDFIELSEKVYRIAEHPRLPGFAYVQEGRKAWIYKLQDIVSNQSYALKIFKPSFRSGDVALNLAHLKHYEELPGMQVCNRLVVTSKIAPDLVAKQPDLEFAILMPWIDGFPWSAILMQRMMLSSETCYSLASKLAAVLSGIENNNSAHCDLAGENVIVDISSRNVELIDIEDMYGFNFQKPLYIPAGGDGYQHGTSRNGQWHAEADRFAGSILLSEILMWYKPEIREGAFGEQYFDPFELQKAESIRYRKMVDMLESVSGRLAEIFDRAWYSSTLKECPRISEWVNELALIGEGTWVQAGDATHAYNTILVKSVEEQLEKLNQMLGAEFEDIKRGQTALYRYIGQAQGKTIYEISKVIELDRVEQGEIARTLDAIRRAMIIVLDSNSLLDADLRQFIMSARKVIDSHLGVSQKLEVTLPIIPLLLDYKIELESGSNADWQAAINEVKQRWQGLLSRVQ